jgi:hypothetical protein
VRNPVNAFRNLGRTKTGGSRTALHNRPEIAIRPKLRCNRTDLLSSFHLPTETDNFDNARKIQNQRPSNPSHKTESFPRIIGDVPIPNDHDFGAGTFINTKLNAAAAGSPEWANCPKVGARALKPGEKSVRT